MKQKLNKTIQKIALILVCITTLNFIAPIQTSNASVGGVLFNPFKTLVVTVIDIAMDVLDYGFTGSFKHIIHYNAIDADRSDDDRFDGNDSKVSMPFIKVTPEKIFSNKIEL